MPADSRSAADALRPLLANKAVAQFVRFVVAGVGVTLLSTLVYLGLAMSGRCAPLIANAISHLAGVAAGYAVHARWSFRVEARRDASMMARFAVASAMSFAANSLWVWLATAALHWPAWTPVPAMVFATPLLSFALNRYWVFAAPR